MPLDNSRVIPEGWAAHHRPVVDGTFTATCEIREPGGTEGPLDRETGLRPLAPHAPHYTGGCRVQVAPMFSGEREAAGQEVTVVNYLVVVELAASAATATGHLVTFTDVDDNSDPTLVDRELTVTGVASGSLAWERDLTCVEDQG